MRYVPEKDFKLRASQLGATRFTEKHLEHTMSFLGEEINYTVLLDESKKSKGVPIEGHLSIDSIAKAMAEVFQKKKLPHAGDASYFRKKLLGKSDLKKYMLFENMSRIFVVLFGAVLFSLFSIMVSNQITGYSLISILNFDYVEKSFVIGAIVFVISIVILAKLFVRKD